MGMPQRNPVAAYDPLPKAPTLLITKTKDFPNAINDLTKHLIGINRPDFQI